MAQSTMILPFSILILATPISFSAEMISCRLALHQGNNRRERKNFPFKKVIIAVFFPFKKEILYRFATESPLKKWQNRAKSPLKDVREIKKSPLKNVRSIKSNTS